MDPVIEVCLVIYSNESLVYMPSRNITEGCIAMAQSLVPSVYIPFGRYVPRVY